MSQNTGTYRQSPLINIIILPGGGCDPPALSPGRSNRTTDQQRTPNGEEYMADFSHVHPGTPTTEHNMPFVPGFLIEGGKLVFLSGMGPLPIYHKHPHDPVEEAKWYEGDFRDQCWKTFKNIELIMKGSRRRSQSCRETHPLSRRCLPRPGCPQRDHLGDLGPR